MVERVIVRTEYRDVLDGERGGRRALGQNIQELATLSRCRTRDLEPPAGLAAFLEETSLVADVDGLNDEKSRTPSR